MTDDFEDRSRALSERRAAKGPFCEEAALRRVQHACSPGRVDDVQLSTAYSTGLKSW